MPKRSKLQTLASLSNYTAFKIKGVESQLVRILKEIEPKASTIDQTTVQYNNVKAAVAWLIPKLLWLREEHYEHEKRHLISTNEMEQPKDIKEA